MSHLKPSWCLSVVSLFCSRMKRQTIAISKSNFSGMLILTRSRNGKRREAHMRTFVLLLFGLICCLSLYAQDPQAAGSAVCLDCHDEIGAFTQKGAHRHLMFLGKDGRGCEACHGNGWDHVESMEGADILGGKVLGEWANEQKSDACLSCHQDNIHGWLSSPHESDLSCWDCHGEILHFREPDEQKQATCAECHKDVAMRSKLQYRHPISCEECHNPHQEIERDADNTELCLRCHVEYQGPFVYEHGALDDGCQACHDPHGAPQARMLIMTGNALCLQCHTQSSFPGIGKKVHSSQLSGGAFCYDCHTDVHGSNIDPSLIRRRR